MLKIPSFDMNSRPCAFQRTHYRTPKIQCGGDPPYCILSPKYKNAIVQPPHYRLVLRARHSPSPNQITKLRHGHRVSCGLSATAELLVKYKLVCYWLVHWNLKFFGKLALCSAPPVPHWRKVSAGAVAWQTFLVNNVSRLMPRLEHWLNKLMF